MLQDLHQWVALLAIERTLYCIVQVADPPEARMGLRWWPKSNW